MKSRESVLYSMLPKPILKQHRLLGLRRAQSVLHETTLQPRLHQVRCQASASEVAGQTVAPAGLCHVSASSRLHVSAAFEAVAEVAKSNA